MPSRASPTLHRWGQNHKWPTYGRIGYLTHAVRGLLNVSERGKNQKWPTLGRIGYIIPTV